MLGMRCQSHAMVSTSGLEVRRATNREALGGSVEQLLNQHDRADDASSRGRFRAHRVARWCGATV